MGFAISTIKSLESNRKLRNRRNYKFSKEHRTDLYKTNSVMTNNDTLVTQAKMNIAERRKNEALLVELSVIVILTVIGVAYCLGYMDSLSYFGV